MSLYFSKFNSSIYGWTGHPDLNISSNGISETNTTLLSVLISFLDIYEDVRYLKRMDTVLNSLYLRKGSSQKRNFYLNKTKYFSI